MEVVGLSKLERTVRSICKKTAASGAVDGTDCRCADGAYAGKRRNCDDRGGAYVHDYARNQEAGNQTVTLARRGVFETDPALEERFFRMLER